jgi:polysaccharide deacetylase family protein (PEP-CTERM system associated)
MDAGVSVPAAATVGLVTPRAGAVERAAITLNAMTIDVEDYFQVSAFEGTVPRSSWDERPSRVAENTERMLDLLDASEVRGTFFVLGWIAERHPEVVRRIAARGHEVGSHGHSHRLVYEQSPDEFRDELLRSKRVLEELTGTAVAGHRAASFSIGPRSLWALDTIAEAGFVYDSSLFPVVHDRYGMPGAPRGPYRLVLPSGRSLVELPPSTLAIAGLTLPIGGGGYLRLYPLGVTSWALERLNRREALPGVVYVHPWELDPDQPRIAGAPLVSRMRHYVNLESTASKLAALMRRHRFAPAREVLDAYRPLRDARLDGGMIRIAA